MCYLFICSVCLFRFHIYVKLYSIHLSLSDWFHLVQYSWGPSILSQMALFHSFLWPSDIPWYIGPCLSDPLYLWPLCTVNKSLLEERIVIIFISALPQSCLTVCHPVDCSPPGSSVHGILQARILEWVAISSCRGFSWPRDRTRILLGLLYRQVGSLPLNAFFHHSPLEGDLSMREPCTGLRFAQKTWQDPVSFCPETACPRLPPRHRLRASPGWEHPGPARTLTLQFIWEMMHHSGNLQGSSFQERNWAWRQPCSSPWPTGVDTAWLGRQIPARDAGGPKSGDKDPWLQALTFLPAACLAGQQSLFVITNSIFAVRPMFPPRGQAR